MRKVPGCPWASFRYRPMGVSASARTLSRTGMTRLWPASSRNSPRLGLMVPRSCMAVLVRLFFERPGVAGSLDVLCWDASGRLGAGPGRVFRLACLACDDVKVPAVEAGPRPGVAGGTYLVDAHQEGVAVAVHGHGFDPLDVSGGVPLAPVLLAGAGVERHASGGHGAVQGFVVHPAEHEHFVRVILLHHGGHQARAIALEGGGHLLGKRARR